MRLRFFYGWIIIAVTFVTMAIGVNARTVFSLLFPPILGEFGWDRGVTAGAFSFGFVVSAVMSPLIGRMMDRFGPRAVMELGVALEEWLLSCGKVVTANEVAKCVQSRLSREAYRQERIIGEQSRVIALERERSERLLLNVLPAGVVTRHDVLGFLAGR